MLRIFNKGLQPGKRLLRNQTLLRHTSLLNTHGTHRHLASMVGASARIKSEQLKPKVSLVHERRQRKEFQFLKSRDLDLAESEPDRLSFSKSRQLPDFDSVTPEILGRRKKLDITDEMAKVKHPLEYFAEDLRAREDPYTRLGESSLLLTNFPKGVNISKQFIKNLCLEQEADAVINRIRLQEAFRGKGQKGIETQNEIAYAIVDFESPAWMNKVRRGLLQTWIHEKKLKLKTLEDRNKEVHKDRTVIMNGIPSHLRPDELASEMAKYGAITNIELPTVDQFVQAQIDKKAPERDPYERARRAKKERDYRLAKLLERQEAAHQEIEHLLKDVHGEEGAEKIIKEGKQKGPEFNSFDLLDSERYASFCRLMTQLQSEGLRVESSRVTIGSLAKEIESRVLALEGEPDLGASSPGSEASTDASQVMEGKKKEIKEALNYLMRNKENLTQSQAIFLDELKRADKDQDVVDVDPLYKMQRMSMSELTGAYDTLLSILKGREKLIQRRIKAALEDFGVQQRVLHQSHDFSKEQEEMPDILGTIYRGGVPAIDEYLSVNEQIQNMYVLKNLTPEQKIYSLMTGKVPVEHEVNFSEPQLAHAQGKTVQHERMAVFPDPSASLSQLRTLGRAPMPFHEPVLQDIRSRVKKMREEMDTPFDELYHKERKLVLDIVRLEKTLKDIRETQPNPAINRMIGLEEIEDDHAQYGNIYMLENQSQFQKDQQRQKQLSKRQNLLSEAEADMASSENGLEFQYSQVEKETIAQLIESGQVPRAHFEQAKQQHIANRHVNLGYAFVTFSHADEARQLLLSLAGSELKVGHNLVQVTAKGMLDHSELDKSYFMRKMKNDARVADHVAELREAKKKLREYEQNIDQEMPKTKRLQEFKSIVQELIEKPKYRTRRHESQRRTKREQEELHHRMKQLQEENPDLDLTQLFESERAEKARREQHKRAFQQFKKYEFLKAGILDTTLAKEEKRKAKQGRAQQDDIFEPYNYPPLKDSVSAVLTDGVQATINVRGEINRRPGRKFNYDEGDFLESYLGRDYTAKIHLADNEQNQIFGFQKTLKELFPNKSEYMKLPELLEQEKRAERYVGDKQTDGELADPAFGDHVAEMDQLEFHRSFDSMNDVEHPTEPNRTFLGDFHKEMGNFTAKMAEQGRNQWTVQEIDKIYSKTLADYFGKKMSAEDELAAAEEQRALLEERFGEIEALHNQIGQEADKVMGRSGGRGASEESPDEAADEALPEEEASLEPEQGFEEESMFNPGQGSNEFQYEEVEGNAEEAGSSNEANGTQYKFGDAHLYRQSNENIYNIKHATQKKYGPVPPVALLKVYKEMAKRMTEQRREHFKQVQKEQFSLPEELRTPHYIDQDGQLRAYSLEQIEQHRKKSQIPIPSTEPTYQEWKEGKGASKDRVSNAGGSMIDDIHPELQEEILGSEDANQSLTDQISSFRKPAPLQNVLKSHVNDVVQEVTVADVLNMLKDKVPITESLDDGSGLMHLYQRTHMDETDVAKFNFREQESGLRSLAEFMDSKMDKESDIYQAYIQAMQQPEEAQAESIDEETLQDLYAEAKESMVKTPDLQSYYERQAAGKSLIDDFSGVEYERQVEDEEISHLNAEQAEEEAYRKELLSRMIGGKLSARQYALLMRMPEDELERSKYEKQNREKAKQRGRDDIRNAEEMLESIRRHKVHTGEWPEDESHVRLQQQLEDIQSKFPTRSSFDVFLREKRKHDIEQMERRNSSQLLEREYYFDESLGQSLQEHAAELRSQYPDVDIVTRRDDDGFPIVKLSMKRQYKYDIDEIINSDPDQNQRIQNETLEAMLDVFMPSDPKEFVEKAATGEAFDGVDFEALDKLIQKRYDGAYKDDIDGFIEQCKLLKKDQERQLRSGKKKQGMPPGIIGFKSLLQERFANMQQQSAFLHDQERFDFEIQEQMALRAREKMSFTKLKESDLVKGTRSENLMYRDQVQSLSDTISILEKDNEWLLKQSGQQDAKDGQDDAFDKEKFEKLKKEIRMRKEAKERVLAQGFAEFKPYVRM